LAGSLPHLEPHPAQKAYPEPAAGAWAGVAKVAKVAKGVPAMRIRQSQLDFLRGVAATYVVINHARGHFFIGGDKLIAAHPSALNYLIALALQATSLGAEMVILFFVLSGFAMAHSVSRSSSIPLFYTKRVIRIWPPYIAATLLAFAVGALIGVAVPLIRTLLYIEVATKVTPQFWSLPYEVVFYALCPFAVGRKRDLAWFAGVAAIGALATVAIHGIALNPWRSFFANFLGNEMLFFACGAAAYHYFERIPRVGPKTLAAVVAGAFVATIGFKGAFGGSNMLCNLSVIAATVLTIRNLPERIPAWMNLGAFSYSIYIYHFALMALLAWSVSRLGVDPMRITNPFAWMLVPPVIIAGCYLLYLFTERPCNRYLASLRRATPAAPPSSSGLRLEA